MRSSSVLRPAHISGPIQFDADRADLLQMQDEIVTRLARTLEVQLWKVDAARLARSPPGNASAEDLALRCSVGVYNYPIGADYTLCERALQIDPRNARALTMMTLKSIEPVTNAQSADREGDIRRSDEYVTQAIAVEPNYYAAHHMRVWV